MATRDRRQDAAATETIPALSVWQPWASALACGVKQYETRHWQTSYRGPLLIHAAKTRECLAYGPKHPDGPGFPGPFCRNFAGRLAIEAAGFALDYNFPTGAILGVAELTDCLPVTMRNGVGTLCLAGNARQDLSELETALGDFSPGRFGWQLDKVRLLAAPVPYRGAQGLFRVRVADVPGLAELLGREGKHSNHRGTEHTEGGRDGQA